MGRQNCNSTAVHSSIALLQERFRQLERAKEMRQQREQLLRLFSEPEQANPQFFRSELILPTGEPLQGSLYVQSNLRNKPIDQEKIDISNSENLWSGNSVMHIEIRNNFDEQDVDTSLHLWKKFTAVVSRILVFLFCFSSRKFCCFHGAVEIEIDKMGEREEERDVTSVYHDSHCHLHVQLLH